MNNLYDALEVCLQELENGADLETVLFRYPDLADELRPILETAVKARSIPVPGPSAEAVRRKRARVLQHAAQLREGRAQSSRRLWTVPLRRMIVSLTMIVALFVSGTGLVQASSTTLPGDNLYPVKRTWEDIRLLFTFNAQRRESLEIEHENERHEELYELFAEGRSEEVDFAGTVSRQTGDLWIVSKVPVVISPQTDLRDGQVQVGDAIRVRGFTQVDGSVLAERVDILSEGTPLPDVDDDDPGEYEREDHGNENESEENNSGRGSRDGSSGKDGNETPENENGSGSNSQDDDDNHGNDNDDGNDNSNEDDNSGSNDNDDDDSSNDASGGDDDNDNGEDDD
jgi:hypothetical protein